MYFITNQTIENIFAIKDHEDLLKKGAVKAIIALNAPQFNIIMIMRTEIVSPL